MQRKVFDRKVFNRKLVVITGGCAGIGRALAVRMAQAGARLVIFDLHQDALDGLVQHLADHHNADALGLCCDVSDAEAVQRAIALVVERYGGIDVLVNNAGIGTAVPALKETPEQFRGVVDVNLNGAYWAAKECAAVMEPGASIVNVASVLGLTAGFAPQAAYSATKAAVLGLTRDLAAQWGSRRGIRVNALAPGYFASEMTDEIPEKMLADITGSTIFGRLGLQPELDSALLFLASDASSFITGTTLVVDGGMTMH